MTSPTSWKAEVKIVLRTIFGLLVAGVGAFFLRLEMKSVLVHSGHVYLFASFIAIGCLVAVPSVMAAAISQGIKFFAAILEALRSGMTPPPPAAP